MMRVGWLLLLLSLGCAVAVGAVAASLLWGGRP